MSDRTTKDLFGDGYTTYHDDGSTSHTTKDYFGDGYTTYHDDGSTSRTTKNMFGEGTTTYHSDGTYSHTNKDMFGDGYTTYHSDGSTSHTTKELFGNGYTTYHSGRSSGRSYSGGFYGGGSSGGGYSGGVSVGLYPGLINPIGIIGALLFAGGIGFLLWWDSYSFPTVLYTLWAVVLVAGMIERNRHNDYGEQHLWHSWSMLLALLLGIYLLFHRASFPADSTYIVVHYLVPIIYMYVMVRLCWKANGIIVNDWIVYWFVILMCLAWLMTIYDKYAGYEGLVSVVIDGILGTILMLSLIAIIIRESKRRLAILPIFLVFYGVWYVGNHITRFYGFHLIKNFIIGLIRR